MRRIPLGGAVLFFALLGVAVLASTPRGARAQLVPPTATATAPPGSAIERIAPPTQNASINQTSFSVDVTVENAADVGAYDVLITYDSAVVGFISATNGPFLASTGREVFCAAPFIRPLTGTLQQLEFGCGTLGPAPPPGASGVGTLATVSFQPLAVGVANLTLDPSLADVSGNTLPAVAYGGQVNIADAPTATPTSTFTPAPTATPCPGGICPTPTPQPCAPTLVQVAPSSVSGSPFVVLSVPLTVTDVCNLGGFSVTLAYDPAILTFADAQPGPFLSSSGRSAQCLSPQLQPGSVTVSCVTLGTPPPDGASGSGLLAVLYFVPTTLGTSPLGLQSALLTPAADPLPATTVGGSATISACAACVTVTPTAAPSATPTPTATVPPSPTASPTACNGPCPTAVIATPTSTPTLTPATVFVSPPASQAQTGTTFSVDVDIANAVNVGAFSFLVQFDPTLLVVQAATIGPFLGSTGRSTFCSLDPSAAGSARFSCGTLGATLAGASGGGTLAALTFGATAVGTSPLALRGVTLLTPSGGAIPLASAQGGSVTVTACSATCSTPTATPAANPTATPVPSGTPIVSISPSTFNVSPGTTFTADVDVSGVSNLGAFQFVYQFNDSAPFFVQFVGVQPGAFLGSTGRPVTCQAPIVTMLSVQYACGTTGAGAVGPSGSGVLATLTFQAVSLGTTPSFGVTSASLTDPLGDDIPVQTAPLGSVTSLPPTPTPTATPGPSGLANPLYGGQGAALSTRLNRYRLTPSEARWLLIALISLAVCGFATVFPRERFPRRARRARSAAALLSTLIAAALIIALRSPDTLDASTQAVLYQSPASANLFVGGQPLVVTQSVSGVGAPGLTRFDLDLRYDPNLIDLTLAPGGFLASTGRTVACTTTTPNFFERVFSCSSSGSAPPPTGQGDLAYYTMRPKDAVASSLVASAANGGTLVWSTLISGTQLVDAQGSPLSLGQVSTAVLALRALEGDVNHDCAVNGIDLMMVAAHEPATLLSPNYNRAYDFDANDAMDVRDLQFVLGRQGSTCAHPSPAQDPPPTTSSAPASTPAASSVGGVAEEPDVNALPSRTATAQRGHRIAYELAGVVGVLAVVAAGAYARSRRRDVG
jgi:Cohesin domain